MSSRNISLSKVRKLFSNLLVDKEARLEDARILFLRNQSAFRSLDFLKKDLSNDSKLVLMEWFEECSFTSAHLVHTAPTPGEAYAPVVTEVDAMYVAYTQTLHELLIVIVGFGSLPKGTPRLGTFSELKNDPVSSALNSASSDLDKLISNAFLPKNVLIPCYTAARYVNEARLNYARAKHQTLKTKDYLGMLLRASMLRGKSHATKLLEYLYEDILTSTKVSPCVSKGTLLRILRSSRFNEFYDPIAKFRTELIRRPHGRKNLKPMS